MSITAIDPVYKDWVKGIDPGTISAKIDELDKEFTETVQNILYSSVPDSQINKSISDIRKRLLYTQLAYNGMTEVPAITASLGKLAMSVNLVNQYEQRETLVRQKRSIDILTYVSIIILPLTLITGYFGMNWSSMGMQAKKTGILTLRWGQLFVFLISAITIIASIIILNHYYKLN